MQTMWLLPSENYSTPTASPPPGLARKEFRMLRSLRNFRWREAIPRIIADFLLVHFSMIAALAVSVVYQTGAGNAVAAHAIVSGFLQYYSAFFLVLSPIFPLVFLLNGFYTHSRAYDGRYKALIILRGVTLAAIIFFAANFLLFSNEKVGRSVALPFMVLAAAGAASVRIFKDFLEKRYFMKPKTTSSLAPRRDWVLVVGGAGYIGSLLVERRGGWCRIYRLASCRASS